MRSVNYRWLGVGLLVLAALSACASDQETINRVQADGAIQKSLLLSGEWYTHTTVIDTDYGSLTFVGDGDSFNRVKFEVERDFLVARRVDEWIPGSEGDDSITGEGEKNAVIAMYPILSHFDIKRDYNPVTGEEQNVISENTSDRTWDQREYMRIDWKQNLAPDVQFSVTGGMGGIKLLPAQYWSQSEEADSSLKARFEKDESGELYYFDVINKYFSEPAKAQIPGAEGIDACLLVLTSHKDCAPGHILTRRGFLRVVDKDYEPATYTPDRMEHYGFFLNQRDGYDRDYGLARFARQRFVARHNIWQESHKKKSKDSKELVLCSKQEDCGGGGSKCDFSWGAAHQNEKGACTIPHRDRKVRQIAYHLSKGFPEDLVNDGFDLVASWDAAFRQTVASLRRLECEENKGSNCGKYLADKTDPVFVACHNPVAKGDAESCGPAGTIAEIGDIRYHLIGWVNEPQTASPLGFGPSFTDPFTGEIIQATAYVYGAPLDTLTAQARDLLAMLNGDVEDTLLQDDEAYEAWIERLAARDDREEHATREADFHTIPIDGADAKWAAASMDYSWVQERLKTRLGELPKAKNASQLVSQYKAVKKALGQIGEDMALPQKGRARLEALKGTTIEQLLINDETYLNAGMPPPSLFPGQKMTPEELEIYSPLRGRSASGLDALRDARRQLALGRQHCMLDQEFADAGLEGLVRAIDKAAKADKPIKWYGVSYKVSNGRKINYDLVRKMLRHPIFHAVMAHEVGHTLGLRHNFSGSFDALNYSPEYWKLRDDGRMQGRAWDPMTKKEIDGRIVEHQYSTVMDYGVNFIVSDAHGVGHYDHAAIKMGYGDLSEVFTNVPAANVQRIAGIMPQVTSGVIGTIDPGSLLTGSLKTIPYTDWPSLVGGTSNLEARKDVRYTSLKEVSSQLFGSSERAITADGTMPAVPYHYCGDEFSDFQPHCAKYDSGADAYETMQSIIDSYWDYYPISHFMHQRIGFNPDAVGIRSRDRFFGKLESAHRIYSFYRGIFGSIAGQSFLEAPDGIGAYTLGVRAAFDLFRQVIAAPEPGDYTQQTRVDGTTALVAGQAQFAVGTGSIDSFNGRYLRTGYDFGPDFSWLFLNRAGYFTDKRFALETLTKAEAQFVAQDTDADVRQFSTSFYTSFPDEMNELLRGLIANDWRVVSPRLEGGELTYPTGDQILKRGGDMSGTMVDPNFGFSLQVTAMVFGTAYVPKSFSQDFQNKSRIFIKGSAQEITLSVPTVEWTDARSGITYVAGSYLNEDDEETGIGASMLNWALALDDGKHEEELGDWVDNIGVMTWLTGTAPIGQDPFIRGGE